MLISFLGICLDMEGFGGKVNFADLLGDCRKSPKMAILAISRVMKLITYKHQIPSFRVFQQSQQVSQVSQSHKTSIAMPKRFV